MAFDYSFDETTGHLKVLDGSTEIPDYQFNDSLLPIKSVTIPDSVTTIGDAAFYESELESIDLGEGVITIGEYAFGENVITSIVIPDSVTTIGDYAFFDIYNLKSVDLGEGVTTIGEYAFAYASITSIAIPDSVTTIGDRAFYDNYYLESIDLGEGVTTIGEYAFAYSDITSIVIPDSVTTIGDYAFNGTNVRTVFIPESVTEIGGNSFNSDVIFVSDKNNDGFSDEITNYHLFNKSGGVDLTNRGGRTYSDNTSRKWDAIKAVETDAGFSVLIEGHLSKEGKYKVVTADDEGVIGGATRWLSDQQMFRNGYEEIFDVDFNGNGVVDLV